MTGDPEFVVLKYSTWLDTTEFAPRILGAIVKEFLRPTNAYEPESPLRYNAESLVKGSFTNFVARTTASASHSVVLSLQSLAGLKFRGSTSDEVHLNGKLIRWERLQQHSRFWAKLKEDPVVKSEVLDWVKKGGTWPPCLVVGIMICEEIDLSVEEEKEHEKEIVMKVPVVEAAAAASGVPPNLSGGIGDPEFEVKLDDKAKQVFKGKVKESKIFALELRKVTKKLWRDQLTLEGGAPRPKGKLLGNEDEVPAQAEPITVEDLVIEELSREDLDDIDDCM